MENRSTRRNFLLTSAAAGLIAFAHPALALSTGQARSLIDRLVGEINAVINSRQTEVQMYAAFEKIFERYADVAIIARTTLGPPARVATAAQMRAYTAAFQGYVSRKYGARFREFIGGRIEVVGARKIKSFYEVRTTAILRGEAPFTVTFLVSDRERARSVL